MKSKKYFLSLTSMFAVLGMLVGCGENTSNGSETQNSLSSAATSQATSEASSNSQTGPTEYNFKVPEGGFDTTKNITIDFYSTMGQSLKEAFDDMLNNEFKQLYPNITVNHTSIGGYDDVRSQVVTELATGVGPDITYCYADHVALYNSTGRVVQLDGLIADEKLGFSEEEIANFIPGYYEEGRSYGDNRMYSLPFSKSTEVLYYDQTFFEEHNLKVPETWDELEETCKKIQEIDYNSIPLGYDSEANWFITMCEQLKSPYTSNDPKNHFLFDNQTNRQFVEKYKSWYDKGYLTTQQIYKSYTSGLFTEQGQGKTRAYMCIGSSAGASHQIPAKVNNEYPFKVGIAPIPQADSNNKKAISQGPSVCLFNQKDKDPQKVLAAWLLMKWMCSDPVVQATFSMKSGYVPVVKTVNDIPAYADFLEKGKQTYEGNKINDYVTSLAGNVCREMSDWYFTSPAFVGSSAARDAVGQIMYDVFVGNETIDSAFAKALEDCNKAIK